MNDIAERLPDGSCSHKAAAHGREISTRNKDQSRISCMLCEFLLSSNTHKWIPYWTDQNLAHSMCRFRPLTARKRMKILLRSKIYGHKEIARIYSSVQQRCGLWVIESDCVCDWMYCNSVCREPTNDAPATFSFVASQERIEIYHDHQFGFE